MDYDLDHFITYAKLVRDEMTERGYRTMDSVWNKIVAVKPDWKKIDIALLYYDWMDAEYMDICFYNLLEKYRCGGISQEDFDKIAQRIDGLY